MLRLHGRPSGGGLTLLQPQEAERLWGGKTKGGRSGSSFRGFGEGMGSEWVWGVGRRGQERTERIGGKEESRNELFLGTKKIH